jgi:hypothetical protein
MAPISSHHDRLLRVQPVLRLVEDARRGPSMTSSVTSSPRCAGRQCRKMASGAGPRHERVVHVVAPRTPLARRRLLLLPHGRPDVGVDDVGALAASFGSSVSSTIFAPPRARSGSPRPGGTPPGRPAAARSRTGTRRSARSSPCCCRRRSTPPYARAGPAEVLLDGHQVRHDLAGVQQVGEPLMTGTVAKRASSSTSSWAKVRIMMPST